MKPQVVSFRCVLRDGIGQLISTTFSNEVLTQIGPGSDGALPGLAPKLKNLRKGEKRRIALPASEAYGLYDPDLVLEATRRELQARDVRVGDSVQVAGEGGALRPFRVTKLSAQRVWLDGNHPLAGQDLVFEIDVTDARYATKEEIRESSSPELGGRWMH